MKKRDDKWSGVDGLIEQGEAVRRLSQARGAGASRSRKALKIAAGIGIALVASGGIAVAALAIKRPAQRPPSTEIIERTPERLARGTYLVEHVSHCLGCHSGVDVNRFGRPPIAGQIGQGGTTFDKRFGVPGFVAAGNITPDPEFGIGKWTDGEVLRAFREGVDRNGDALFPMMPYANYHAMSDEDARAVVVYLRSLAPVRNEVPRKRIAFPVNLLVKSAPRPIEAPVATPSDDRDHLAYGKYLVTLASCRDCHTPHDDHGQLLPGREFSGGWTMAMSGPGGKVTRVSPPNITPHPTAFFGSATKESWIGRVRAFASMEGDNAPVAPPGRNTVMPWVAFAGLTDRDLGAIYDYMKTVPPIENHVNAFPDAAN
jgi:mono/diheme cytochrome c family protein